MASCIPVLQRPLSQEIKGRSDTGPKLPGQFCPRCLGRDQETSRSWKGVSQRAQLPARAHWPAAGQSPAPSPVPCQSPGLLHLGLHCKEMHSARKHHVTSSWRRPWAHLQSWLAGIRHWGWVSLLVPQDGVSQQAQGRSWEIHWTKAASADTGSVWCFWDPTLQQRRWVWGRLALLPPRIPRSPVQQGSWLQTGWQWHCGRTGAWHWPGWIGPEWGCRSHGRTGCVPPGNLGRSRLSWLPRAHTGQQWLLPP